MSETTITDELRTRADEIAQAAMPCGNSPDYASVRRKIFGIADRIDEEHEKVLGCKVARAISVGEDGTEFVSMPAKELSEHYVELPVDADGEYIHIGDVLAPPADCDDYVPLQVMRLTYDGYEEEWFFDGEAGGFCGMAGQHMDVAGWTHHHAPTTEDVLREFAEKITDSQIPGVHPTYAEAIAEYAKRLTLAGCADE